MKTIEKEKILRDSTSLSVLLDERGKELTPRNKKGAAKIQIRDLDLTKAQKAVLEDLREMREALSSSKEREIIILNNKIGNYLAVLEQNFRKGNYRDGGEEFLPRIIKGFIDQYQLYEKQPKAIAAPPPSMQPKAAILPIKMTQHKKEKVEVVALPAPIKKPFLSPLGSYFLKVLLFPISIFSFLINLKFIDKALRKPQISPEICLPIICAGISCVVAIAIGDKLASNELTYFSKAHKPGKHHTGFAGRLTAAKESQAHMAR